MPPPVASAALRRLATFGLKVRLLSAFSQARGTRGQVAAAVDRNVVKKQARRIESVLNCMEMLRGECAEKRGIAIAYRDRKFEGRRLEACYFHLKDLFKREDFEASDERAAERCVECVAPFLFYHATESSPALVVREGGEEEEEEEEEESCEGDGGDWYEAPDGSRRRQNDYEDYEFAALMFEWLDVEAIMDDANKALHVLLQSDDDNDNEEGEPERSVTKKKASKGRSKSRTTYEDDYEEEEEEEEERSPARFTFTDEWTKESVVAPSNSDVDVDIDVNWVEQFDPSSGYNFYYNKVSGESSWDPPSRDGVPLHFTPVSLDALGYEMKEKVEGEEDQGDGGEKGEEVYADWEWDYDTGQWKYVGDEQGEEVGQEQLGGEEKGGEEDERSMEPRVEETKVDAAAAKAAPIQVRLSSASKNYPAPDSHGLTLEVVSAMTEDEHRDDIHNSPLPMEEETDAALSGSASTKKKKKKKKKFVIRSKRDPNSEGGAGGGGGGADQPGSPTPSVPFYVSAASMAHLSKAEIKRMEDLLLGEVDDDPEVVNPLHGARSTVAPPRASPNAAERERKKGAKSKGTPKSPASGDFTNGGQPQSEPKDAALSGASSGDTEAKAEEKDEKPQPTSAKGGEWAAESHSSWAIPAPSFLSPALPGDMPSLAQISRKGSVIPPNVEEKDEKSQPTIPVVGSVGRAKGSEWAAESQNSWEMPAPLFLSPAPPSGLPSLAQISRKGSILPSIMSPMSPSTGLLVARKNSNLGRGESVPDLSDGGVHPF